jgi:hypothetical protein
MGEFHMRLRHVAAFTLSILAALAASAAASDAKAANPRVLTPTPAAKVRPRVPQIPADVKARVDRLWRAASPAVRSWVDQNAPGIARGAGDPETLARTAARDRWPNLRAAGGYDGPVFLLIGRAAEVLQADVRNKLDSLSGMGEKESLRLQMAMDRLSKMMSTLSNLLKKISDAADGVVQNLK